MRKNCSNVCKLCPCLATESTNWACMHTIVTAALQQQYSQTELIFWINLVQYYTILLCTTIKLSEAILDMPLAKPDLPVILCVHKLNSSGHMK